MHRIILIRTKPTITEQKRMGGTKAPHDNERRGAHICTYPSNELCGFLGPFANAAPFSLQQSMQNNLQSHRWRSGPVPPPPPPSWTSLLLASFSLPSLSPAGDGYTSQPSPKVSRDCRGSSRQGGRGQGEGEEAGSDGEWTQ